MGKNQAILIHGNGGATSGEGGGDAGEAAAAGAPSDAGRSGMPIGGSSDSGGAGAGVEPSESGSGGKRASDSGCSYGSKHRGHSSTGLALLAAFALGLIRRQRS